MGIIFNPFPKTWANRQFGDPFFFFNLIFKKEKNLESKDDFHISLIYSDDTLKF